MLAIVLLPVIPAIWWLATRPIEDAVLDIFLPVLILIPGYYAYPIPHFMDVNAWEASLFPIAAVTFFKYIREWRFQRSDLWILLFVIGDGFAEGRNGLTRGLRAFFVTMLSALLPYILGKLLMEKEDLRERFLRRLVWLGALVAVIDILEFRLAKNIFIIAGKLLFSQGSPNDLQVRGGFIRTQGPFGHAITAGMVFATLWILARWIGYVDKQGLGPAEPKYFGIRRSAVLAWTLFGGLLMTHSRGPWLGAVAAFGISLVGSAKHVKRTAILVLLFGVIGSAAAYSYLEVYTAGDISQAKDQDQENAIYRRLLLDNYAPVIKEGGLFGWGEGFPRVEGQPSIDNEYLWLRLTQGPWGLTFFLLLAAESSVALIAAAKRSSDKENFYFAVALLAVIIGMLATLTTVSLGPPAYQMLFLFFGWSLSLRTQPRRYIVPVLSEETQKIRIFA